MIDLTITGFDKDTFLTQFYSFGIPFIVFTVAFFIILHIFFDWRPFKYRKYVIANLLKKDINDCSVVLLDICFFVFCLLPFVFSILWGVMTAIKVEPNILGIDIAIAPSAFILLVLGVMNFIKNGYKITKSVIIVLGLSGFLLIGLTVLDVFLIPEKSWMSGAYLTIFPSLLFYAFWICLFRKKIPHEKAISIMSSEEEGNKFVTDITEGRKDEWIDSQNISLQVVKMRGIVASLVISLFFLILFAINWRNYSETSAMVATCLGALFVDVAAIITIHTSLSRFNMVLTLFIALVLKAIAISFSSRFWMAGHALLFVFIGTYFLYRVFYWLFEIIFIREKKYDLDNLPDNVKDAIQNMKTDTNTISFQEAILSLCIFIVFLIAAIVEAIIADGADLEPIDGSYMDDDKYIENILKQGDLMSACIILTISLSITFASYTQKIYSIKWRWDFIPFWVSIVFIYVLIFTACDVEAFDLCYYIPSLYTLISACFLGISRWMYFIPAIGASLCTFIGPIVSGKTGFAGMIIFSIICLCTSFYICFFKFKYGFEVKQGIWFVVMCIVYFYFFIWTCVGITPVYLGFTVAFAITIILVLVYASKSYKSNDMSLTKRTFIILLVSSSIVFIFGLIGFAVSNIVAFSVMFLGIFGIIGTCAFRFKENERIYNIIILIGVILEVIDFFLAIFLSGSLYISVTLVCAAIFVLSLCYCIVLHYNNGVGQTTVFSEIFFPTRILDKGKLLNLHSLGIAVILVFASLWIWGIISTVFFIFPWYGILGQIAAFSIALFLVFGELYDFDLKAIEAFDLVPKPSLKYIVKKSRATIGASTLDFTENEELDETTYENFLKSVEIKTQAAVKRSIFSSAIRGQLKLSSEVEFVSILTTIRNYMNKRDVEWIYIFNHKSFNYDERQELLTVYKEIEKLNAEEKQKEKEYRNHVKNQEMKRKLQQEKLLFELRKKLHEIQSDSDSETSHDIEDGLRNEEDNGRQNEEERRRIEEERRRRQEEEERRIKWEAEERKREEEERRRQEEEERRFKLKEEEERKREEEELRRIEEEQRRQEEDERRSANQEEDFSNEKQQNPFQDELSRVLQKRRNEIEKQAERIPNKEPQNSFQDELSRILQQRRSKIQKQEEDYENQKKEEENRRRQEEEQRRIEEEENRRSQEEEIRRRRQQEENMRRRIEENRLRRQQEENQRRQEEENRRRKFEEERKKRQQEENIRRQEEEERRRRVEEENRRRRQEAAERRRRQDEENRRQQDEDNRRRQQEENRRRREEEERKRREIKIIDLMAPIKSSEYENIVQSYQNTNTKYKDPNFYPSRINHDDDKLLSYTEPVRAEEYNSGKFMASVDSDDIKQGVLGDCYFLASLAVLSHDPIIIERIFHKPILSKNGVYCVNFKIFNKLIPIVVDSFLPNYVEPGYVPQLKFSKPRKNNSSWWFSIIEKAFAKLNGSFSNIEGGNPAKTMYLFVDGLAQNIFLDEPEWKEKIANGQLFEMMYRINNEGSFLCASSEKSNCESKGIVYDHAYSILRVVKVQGFKLLQMKNPWAEKEWNGDWSDKSPLWQRYPAVARELDQKDEDDGKFWISFDDFVDTFNNVNVLDQKKDCIHYMISGTFNPGEDDGASGCDGPNLTHVPNYLVRFTKRSNIILQLQRTGAEATIRFYMAYVNGKPLDRMYVNLNTRSFGMGERTESLDFSCDIDQYNQPWTLAISREKVSKPCDYAVHIWCEDDIEITELPINNSRFPPHKLTKIVSSQQRIQEEFPNI